eukprot:SAG11_NODE_124_length_15798_cov_14.675776_19_plen_200_part_00
MNEPHRSKLALPTFAGCDRAYAYRTIGDPLPLLGELGYELYVPSEQALHVYDKIVHVGEREHGLVHAGLKALASLRLEKRYLDHVRRANPMCISLSRRPLPHCSPSNKRQMKHRLFSARSARSPSVTLRRMRRRMPHAPPRAPPPPGRYNLCTCAPLRSCCARVVPDAPRPASRAAVGSNSSRPSVGAELFPCAGSRSS